MNSIKSKPKIQFLTGFRGLAIILVLLFHFKISLFSKGFLGVDLFFWLSGFLLTRNFIFEYSQNRLYSQRRIGWIDLRFYAINRIRRIFPIMILILTFHLLLLVYLEGTKIFFENKNQLFHLLSFTQNFFLLNANQDYFAETNLNQNFLHYWSLSVEMQIYLILPFIVIMAVSKHGLKFRGFTLDWSDRILLALLFVSLMSISLCLSGDIIGLDENYIFYNSICRF